MATVYKAYDTRLEREVAVKVIRRDAFPAEHHARIFKRFEREARALEKLSHPHIVSVIEYGEHEGLPFLVMEYVSGGTLKQRLEKPIPWAEAIQLILPITRALDYAHERGIIHRDVKPSNILIAASGAPMLTDFGIAKVLESGEGQTLSTTTGIGIGTPEYMAPEQGLGHEVDARADIYSLGIVLYEMITGRKPFRADTPMAVIVKHINEPLPRPKQFARDVPEAVERTLFKALEKKPDGRFRNMRDLTRALENALEKQTPTRLQPRSDPANSSPKSEGQRDSRRGARQQPSRILYWAIALIAFGIVGATGWLIRQSNSNTRVSEDANSVIRTAILTEIPTGTAQPTSNPLILEGTLIPSGYLPISLINAGELEGIASWDTGIIGAIRWSPDGRALAAASPLSISFYNLTGTTDGNFIETDSYPNTIEFSPDGLRLVSGMYSGLISVWDVRERALEKTLSGTQGEINSLAFSPDGSLLAAAATDPVVEIWRIYDGMLTIQLRGHTAAVRSVEFSSDGNWLITGSYDGTVRIWRASDGRLMRTLDNHDEGVLSVAISPDGQWVASSSYDKTVRIWSLADGSLVHTLRGHTGGVYSLAFSSDGTWMVSGSSDKTIRIWRTLDGALISTLTGHTKIVKNVVISPDSTFIASGSDDGTIRIWGVAP